MLIGGITDQLHQRVVFQDPHFSIEDNIQKDMHSPSQFFSRDSEELFKTSGRVIPDVLIDFGVKLFPSEVKDSGIAGEPDSAKDLSAYADPEVANRVLHHFHASNIVEGDISAADLSGDVAGILLTSHDVSGTGEEGTDNISHGFIKPEGPDDLHESGFSKAVGKVTTGDLKLVHR